MENNNLRKAQLCLLELLSVFKKICEEEHIPYFLNGGTALGAVRHQGFIPWDDDIDVALFREDYDRLIEVGTKYLPEGVAFQHFTLDDDYQDYTLKLVNENISYVEQWENGEVRQKLWIDIFPLDGTPNHSLMRFFHYRVLDYHKMLLGFYYVNHLRMNPNRSLLKRMLIGFAKIIPVGKLVNPTKRKKKLDKAFRKYLPAQSDVIGNYMGAYTTREFFLKSVFGDGCEVLFEGSLYKAPAEVDQYLRGLYGEYLKLPPLEERFPKHHIIRIDLLGNVDDA